MSRSKEIPSPENIDLYIFDMDGTTYLLDGEENGFRGSSLEKMVHSNLVRYVSDKESLSIQDAEMIVNEARKSGVQLSYFFSKRYETTRQEYFNTVWDINPETLVQEYQTAVATIKKLSSMGKPIILVTSSPSIWAIRVCQFLQIDDVFSNIITGEDFKVKEEVLLELSRSYDPSRIISIGDQFETEIEPAQKLGMQTLHLKHPDETDILLGNKKDEI